MTNIKRVTTEQVESVIAQEVFFTAAEGLAGKTFDDTYSDEDLSAITVCEVVDAALNSASPGFSTLDICVLVLKNGYTVVGKATPVDPAAYSKEVGQRIARERAVEQIWPLLGYELKSTIESEE